MIALSLYLFCCLHRKSFFSLSVCMTDANFLTVLYETWEKWNNAKTQLTAIMILYKNNWTVGEKNTSSTVTIKL